MAMTSGTATAIVAPDLSKSARSYRVPVAAGAGVAQVVAPSNPMQAATIWNKTSNLMRMTITFAAGIAVQGIVGEQTHLIPAGETWSVDFSDHDGDNAVGALDPIASISLIAVQNTGAAIQEASLLTATTALVPAIAGTVFVNFANS